MRDWGFLPSSDDLAAVAAAARLYRDRWASIRAPFPAAFDGSIDDIQALDYLDYEGVQVVGGGIEPAAMVCGEVLRRVAGLEWVISYRGDWFVASRDDALHAVAICPLARLHEIECSGRRGAAMHMGFLQKAVFDCFPFLEGGDDAKAREVLARGGDYIESAEWTLERLRRPDARAPGRGHHR